MMTKNKERTCKVCGKSYSSAFPYCTTACKRLAGQSRKRDRAEWYELQLEVARPLGGAVVRGGRQGQYSDVDTGQHLVECKLSGKEGVKIDTAWVWKAQKLASRFGKHPVLVMAIGGLEGHRVVFFLDEEMGQFVRSLQGFMPVIEKWNEDGKEVWVSGMHRQQLEFLGATESIPGLGSLKGARYMADWKKIRADLEVEFEQLNNTKAQLNAQLAQVSGRMLQLQGKFEMATEAALLQEKEEQPVTDQPVPAKEEETGAK